MSQHDDSPWPELEEGHKGYKQGEIVVIGAGAGGRSAIIEQIAGKLIAEGHQVNVCDGDIENIEPPEIPKPEPFTNVYEHPTGKRRKPKKRKLKRKVGKL